MAAFQARPTINDHDSKPIDSSAEEGERNMKMIAFENQDEKELHSIGCPRLSSSNTYDTQRLEFHGCVSGEAQYLKPY